MDNQKINQKIYTKYFHYRKVKPVITMEKILVSVILICFLILVAINI